MRGKKGTHKSFKKKNLFTGGSFFFIFYSEMLLSLILFLSLFFSKIQLVDYFMSFILRIMHFDSSGYLFCKRFNIHLTVYFFYAFDSFMKRLVSLVNSKDSLLVSSLFKNKKKRETRSKSGTDSPVRSESGGGGREKISKKTRLLDCFSHMLSTILFVCIDRSINPLK